MHYIKSMNRFYDILSDPNIDPDILDKFESIIRNFVEPYLTDETTPEFKSKLSEVYDSLDKSGSFKNFYSTLKDISQMFNSGNDFFSEIIDKFPSEISYFELEPRQFKK